MVKKRSKRGISPLVATMLLLSFAVAIGVVVMNFGRAQVELEATCPIDIGLEFSGRKKVCYNAAKSELVFKVENGINIKVEGLLVNVIGTLKAETFELNQAKMIQAGSYEEHLPYNQAISGEIRQIKITPKVIFYDAEQICTEKALIVENVQNC